MSQSFIKDELKKFFVDEEKGKRNIEFVKNNNYVVINLDDVAELHKNCAEDIINNASLTGYEETLNAIKEILVNLFFLNVTPEVGFSGNIVPLVQLHEISDKHKGKLIRVKGIINFIYQSPSQIPTFATFRCSECGNPSVKIKQESLFTLTKPQIKCSACGERPQWDIIPEMTDFVNCLEFSIQELQDDVESGQIPDIKNCVILKNYLIDKNFCCGDSVEVYGIVKFIPPKKTRSFYAFQPYLEIVYMEKTSNDPESIEVTDEEIQEFNQMSKDVDIYKKMIESVAPSLKGHDDEKEGCLLALFGAPEEIRPDITARGTIHILLAGDPSTAKSDLMASAIGIAPKGMTTDARGSSAVGLTATVQKDENGKWRVIAGALVLTDQGVVAVDELDKMRDEDRDILHRVMEQQEVIINKADVHNVILRARTSLIASMNPVFGKYDKYKTLTENLPKIPIPLLTRFDLIFVILDETTEEEDKNVIRAVLSAEKEIQSPIKRAKLRRYIAYAKRIKPILNEEVKKRIEESYIELRSLMRDVSRNEKILITPRQAWTLKRLTLAHARALLKTEADINDFNAAKRLFDVFINSIGHDILELETGENEEKRKTKIDTFTTILDIIKKYKLLNGRDISRSELEEESMKKMERNVFNKFFMELINNGQICEPKPDYFAVVG